MLLLSEVEGRACYFSHTAFRRTGILVEDHIVTNWGRIWPPSGDDNARARYHSIRAANPRAIGTRESNDRQECLPSYVYTNTAKLVTTAGRERFPTHPDGVAQKATG